MHLELIHKGGTCEGCVYFNKGILAHQNCPETKEGGIKCTGGMIWVEVDNNPAKVDKNGEIDLHDGTIYNSGGKVAYSSDVGYTDQVNSPKHYNNHPSGVECCDIAEHFSWRVGAAIKYLWRHKDKHDDNGVEDIDKAINQLQGEKARLLGNYQTYERKEAK
jgi:hypothetical protein